MDSDFSGDFIEGEPPCGDLPPLEGEWEDIRREAMELFGENWLSEPNANFGWKTPNEVIDLGYAYLVRNNVRLVKYVGSS